MLGKVGECEVVEGEDEVCFPCSTICDHSTNVKDQYIATGFYGSGTVIGTIIDNILKQQQGTLSKLCNTDISMKSLVTMTGFDHCVKYVTFEGKLRVCGTVRDIYTLDPCADCTELVETEEFYLNILKVYRMKKYPHRSTINYICSLFGWTVLYTPDYIYIEIGDQPPARAASVIALLPIPIGVTIKIAATAS